MGRTIHRLRLLTSVVTVAPSQPVDHQGAEHVNAREGLLRLDDVSAQHVEERDSKHQ